MENSEIWNDEFRIKNERDLRNESYELIFPEERKTKFFQFD